MKKNLLISVSSSLLVLASYSTASAQVTPQGIAGQLGTVQQQDIEDIKRIEMEKQGLRDYENRQLGAEQKAKTTAKKRQKATERAKPSEYKTKGVYIEKIEVPDSEILTKEEIADIVKDYEQTNLTMADIKELVADINEMYLDKGYVTARAYLPEQTIENGILKIAVMEGKVGDVKIEGNRWTKESHIKDRLDINEGEIFNVQKLEEDMLIY
ncbi:MAG: ShlB/FhaC/HecB family hemolysin secretion/activation protein, partial [Alphaproteobacteria bacterium]|nr:ShlB/FhaC/HecB family hemolysin secretion/activation protein [Alphaproteobacteria bacterium]